MLAVQTFKERFIGQKAVDDGAETVARGAHSVVGDFKDLAAVLKEQVAWQGAQIDKLRENEHKLRGSVQKLDAYAILLSRHVELLESKLASAGIDIPPRPALPTLN